MKNWKRASEAQIAEWMRTAWSEVAARYPATEPRSLGTFADGWTEKAKADYLNPHRYP